MNELIQQLMKSVGLDMNQAQGAAGLVFKTLKEKLDGGQFSQLKDKLPDVDSLISLAPKVGGLGGLLGGLAGKLGGDSLGKLASLAGGLKDLNIDFSKMDDILANVLSFVKEKGGDQLLNIVKGVLTK